MKFEKMLKKKKVIEERAKPVTTKINMANPFAKAKTLKEKPKDMFDELSSLKQSAGQKRKTLGRVVPGMPTANKRQMK